MCITAEGDAGEAIHECVIKGVVEVCDDGDVVFGGVAMFIGAPECGAHGVGAHELVKVRSIFSPVCMDGAGDVAATLDGIDDGVDVLVDVIEIKHEAGVSMRGE